MNHRVYAPCRWCGEVMTYSERRSHVGMCPESPECAICPYCKVRINTRKGFKRHFANECPSPPEIPPLHKFCCGCSTILPIGLFATDGTSAHSQCKSCKNTKSVVVRNTPEYKAKHRRQNIRGSYGIDYDIEFLAQGGVCAICKQPPSGAGVKERHLHVDHEHLPDDKKGPFRGLLCMSCNHLLGKARDNPETCLEAGRYLLRYIASKSSK